MESDEQLNPGIRRTVDLLNEAGFETTDSGDGETGDHECDRDRAYVVITCSGSELKGEADRLLEWCVDHGVEMGPVGKGDAWIEGSYDPIYDLGIIELVGVDDESLEVGDEG